MTEPSSVDAPVDVPEADLLEQQSPWQNFPADVLISSGPESVTDRTGDEGDLLEQAQPTELLPDDDDERPYGAPS
jgi:hypothetical protein